MKHKKRYQIIDIIIMSILAAGIVIFIMVPFFNILAGAFYYENKFDLRYIKSLFDNKTLLFNSLRLGILTTALTLTAGICVSVYIFICSERLQKFWLMILGITMISPPFVTALSYINLFGRRGLISYRLLHLSVQPYGLTGIVLMQALSDFSLCSLLLYGVLKSIPGYMIDSAKSLGAKTNDIICDIILPNMLPGIKASALLTFLRSISDFGTPAIIGGKYNVLALESYLAVIAQGNLPRAAAVNLLLILPAAAVFVPYHKNLKNLGITSHGIETSNSKIVGKGIVYNCIKAIALFFLLWISMQYISIIFSAFTRMKKGSLVITLENIEETGIDIDAVITSQLIINIFEHNTPLHDGAVVIRGNRISSATCYLPLSDNMNISKDLGTRHRAAIGISEVTDSFTIVVSEETGRISVARSGKLTGLNDAQELGTMLRKLYDVSTQEKVFFLLKGMTKNEKKAD